MLNTLQRLEAAAAFGDTTDGIALIRSLGTPEPAVMLVWNRALSRVNAGQDAFHWSNPSNPSCCLATPIPATLQPVPATPQIALQPTP